MDIKREQIERKTLSEECWIPVSDFELKIGYPSVNHELEFRRLRNYWQAGLGGNHEHYMSYYIRSTVRDVRGNLTDGNLPVRLEIAGGLAMNFVSEGRKPLDVIRTLLELDVLDETADKIWDKLNVTELDKKKHQSQPNLSVTENLESSQSSEGEKSSTPITPSPQTEKITS